MLQQYYEGSHSTVTHMGAEILVDKLLELANVQEYPRMVKISDLIWVLHETEVEEKRVVKANTRFPLIVLEERSGRLVVLDGVHRLVKLTRQHSQFVRCFIIKEAELEALNRG